MKTFVIALAMLTGLGQWGCSGEFWGGTALGALGAGAGYEIQAKRQIDRLEEEYKSGKITREEYESRKRQIEGGSLLY